MRTYWELNENEQAALTEEEFAKYCQCELMVAGIVPPVPPSLPDLPEAPALPKVEWVGVEVPRRYGRDMLPLWFQTLEDAAAFLKLKWATVERNYDADVEYTIDGQSQAASLVVKQYTTVEAAMEHLSVLQRIKAEQTRFVKEQQDFQTAVTGAETELSRMRENRAALHEKVGKYAEIRKTFREYIEMCEGNENTARTFLEKAYGEDMVEECMGWFAENG